jgi:hypothetical protein
MNFSVLFDVPEHVEGLRFVDKNAIKHKNIGDPTLWVFNNLQGPLYLDFQLLNVYYSSRIICEIKKKFMY